MEFYHPQKAESSQPTNFTLLKLKSLIIIIIILKHTHYIHSKLIWKVPLICGSHKTINMRLNNIL